MSISTIFDESDALATEILELVDVPRFDDSPRVKTSMWRAHFLWNIGTPRERY